MTKLEPLIQSFYKLAAQAIILKEDDVENLTIHTKQCLNELIDNDRLRKKITNYKKEQPA